MKNQCRIPVLRLSLSNFLFTIGVLTTLAVQEILAQKPAITPPVAPLRVVTEDYFGAKVSDPYRYMENLSDPGVVKWFKEQDAYTRLVLSQWSFLLWQFGVPGYQPIDTASGK
jgi:hypothetical protein